MKDTIGESELKEWQMITFESPDKTDVPTQEDDEDLSEDETDDVRRNDPGFDDQQSYAEGERIDRPGGEYERNPQARRECLKHWGYRCAVCNFDFAATYGDLGKCYIHVHHLTPLSESGGESRETSPIDDLRPVCPNCHAMLHRESPPVSIERLQEIMQAALRLS